MSPGMDANERWNAQLEVLRFIGESTDDYLFLLDYRNERLYFTGNLSRRYAVLEDGRGYCTVADWCGIVYEKDLPALREELDRIRRGQQMEHNMEYRLVDRSGCRVWISCRGRCQLDEDGNSSVMIGRV